MISKENWMAKIIGIEIIKKYVSDNLYANTVAKPNFYIMWQKLELVCF